MALKTAAGAVSITTRGKSRGARAAGQTAPTAVSARVMMGGISSRRVRKGAQAVSRPDALIQVIKAELPVE